MSNITYQVEKFDPSFVEAAAYLFDEHWKEIARHKDQIKLNPDYDSYYALQELDRIVLTTVRDGDKIVGYMINIVMPHLHYKDHIMADNDILYIYKPYRGRHVFNKLLKYTEKALSEVGAVTMYVHMKTAHDFGPLLEREGFKCIEKNFEKRLV